MEILRPIPAGETKAILFDFDGTISLLRAGWQQIMVDFMVEVLLEVAPREDPSTLANDTLEFVTELTGKQTIYQMFRLCDEIRKRGSEPMDALSYKHRYHDRLMESIRYRIEGLRSGRYQARDWRVRGAAGFLEKLQLKGIPLYLGSGTDQEFVLEEAKLLDVDRFFPGRIFGALDEYTKFSKEMLITQILSQLELRGAEFMAFGDGYVEIRDTKSAGGVAIGLASREDGEIGWDSWKRRRLVSAGADILIPDFGDAFPLLGCLQRTEPITLENLPS